MTATLAYASKDFWSRLAAFCQTASVPKEVSESVAAILREVREEGDRAVARLTKRFDGAALNSADFPIAPEEMAAALKRLPRSDRSAIRAAVASVAEFHRHALPRGWTAKNAHGATIGERFYPLPRVGLYIPRKLASTVVMTATLAKIAKVPEIVAFTPCRPDGSVEDATLAAMRLAGVTEAYRVGGAQAVAAMAYGTRTIRPVAKVFGPGSVYVVEAKRQVFGQVGVDLLPGPSELMVVADASADPRFVAADLLAQAEHGSGREKLYLVATSERTIRETRDELERQLKRLPAAAAAARPLREGFLCVKVANLDQAAEVADFVAPEHLELDVAPARFKSLAARIRSAGAIMQGPWTATALGDFAAGPSHELPTGRSGRFSSGLQVADFFRRSSLVRYSKKALAQAAPVAEAFARMEGLEAHGRSVSLRLEAP